MNVSRTLSVLLFLLVALLSFSVWAFGGAIFPSEPAMYAGCALVFLGLGGMALLPARERPGDNAIYFCVSFATAYLAYAIIWSVAWFSIPNTFGEVLGSSIGLLVFTAIFVRWNRLGVSILTGTAVVFLFHTFGYYLGGFTYAMLQGRGPMGRSRPCRRNDTPHRNALMGSGLRARPW